jgi:glycosyltransferase involved in cell wall biosynthesis
MKQSATEGISLVITSYNHGCFISDAIDSVLQQDHPLVEVIVVDDGSTDDTREVVSRYPTVRYLHQENRGVAAARNAGIQLARYDYVTFLDADDILLPGALSLQHRILTAHPEAEFVSGGHLMVNNKLQLIRKVSSPFTDAFYLHLLEGNYIGMHAAVLYRRSILLAYPYDTALKGSEDYDLYLRITASHPVINHQEPVAAYRMHSYNISKGLHMMLESVLQVLDKQRPRARLPEEQQAMARGRFNWIYYYGEKMVDQLLHQPGLDGSVRRRYLASFWRYRPAFYAKYLLKRYWRR